MTPDQQHQLTRHLGKLFSESLNVSQPVAMLYILKEKLDDGGYQPFYKADILDELGQLQHRLHQVNDQMLSIARLLKEEG